MPAWLCVQGSWVNVPARRLHEAVLWELLHAWPLRRARKLLCGRPTLTL